MVVPESAKSTFPVRVPPALGNAALAVVLAELAVVVVLVKTASRVAMSIPSTVPVTEMLPVTLIAPLEIVPVKVADPPAEIRKRSTGVTFAVGLVPKTRSFVAPALIVKSPAAAPVTW